MGISTRSYAQQTNRRMKMAYEYVKVSQIHSISQIPPCWAYPLSVLLNYVQKVKKQEL
jgi:hypothetical protein